jgi:hypothetical protein
MTWDVAFTVSVQEEMYNVIPANTAAMNQELPNDIQNINRGLVAIAQLPNNDSNLKITVGKVNCKRCKSTNIRITGSREEGGYSQGQPEAGIESDTARTDGFRWKDTGMQLWESAGKN